jgi:cytochrome c oxidase subunit 4
MNHSVFPTRVYVAVFAGLLALTALTVGVSFFDLGGGRLHLMNALAAISIATAKGLLVVLYFMHVRHSSRFTWVLVGAGVFWLLILITLTMSDILTRQWLPVPPPWG